MESFRYEIDNGHLKEFSYEEFQDLTIISNGSSEVRHAYIETTDTHYVLKHLKENDCDEYYKKLHRE
ncbi:9691_t:CDS:1, partial [Gigaspora rosea]